jgi:hypothetical protein
MRFGMWATIREHASSDPSSQFVTGSWWNEITVSMSDLHAAEREAKSLHRLQVEAWLNRRIPAGGN